MYLDSSVGTMIERQAILVSGVIHVFYNPVKPA